MNPSRLVSGAVAATGAAGIAAMGAAVMLTIIGPAFVFLGCLSAVPGRAVLFEQRRPTRRGVPGH